MNIDIGSATFEVIECLGIDARSLHIVFRMREGDVYPWTHNAELWSQMGGFIGRGKIVEQRTSSQYENGVLTAGTMALEVSPDVLSMALAEQFE
jgi:hypothetical protein